MAWVIFAGVLGVIIITGVLFLRRLLGQLAELRRQITGIDRQMRADRFQLVVLRQFIAQEDNEEDDEDGGPLQEAAVANGNGAPPQPLPSTVHAKKHLTLIPGGAVAALIATAAGLLHEAWRAPRGRVVGALVGSAATATTVTMLTLAPWTDSNDPEPPSSAPTAAPSSTAWPPPTVRPPQPTATDTVPTGPPSPSGSEPEPSPTGSASLTPSLSASPSPGPTSSLVPIVGESPPAQQDPSPPGGDGPPGGGDPTGSPGGGSPPAAGPAPPPPAEPPPDAAPPSATPADGALCVGVGVAPLLDVEACLLGG